MASSEASSSRSTHSEATEQYHLAQGEAMDHDSQGATATAGSNTSYHYPPSTSNKSLATPFLSFDSIPRASEALQDLSVATPPIQQQELILSAISQSVAAAAASDDDEDEDHLDPRSLPGRHMSAAIASKVPIQERGDGWALLGQPRAGKGSHIRSPSATATASAAAAAAAHSRGRSTGPRPLVSASSPADINSHEERPSQGDVQATRPSPQSLHHRHHHQSSLSSSSPAPIDCDTSSRKALDVSAGYAMDNVGEASEPSGSVSRSESLSGRSQVRLGGGTMELPAEGAGLRGKDENKMVTDQEEEAAAEAEAVHRRAASGSSAERVPSASSTSRGASNQGDLAAANPLHPPAARKLCIRHQRMADEGTVGKLQRSIEALPLADQTAVNTVWSIFSSSSHARRALILQGILSMCCFSQLSLLSSELALAIRIDPFSLFPREVSLKVMGHLDAMSLGRAAQVSRPWKALADDDLLWRNMCEQHIERKCEKCGWGLPLLSEKRRRQKGPAPVAGTPESRQLTYSNADLQGKNQAADASPSSGTAAAPASGTTDSEEAGSGTGSLKRSITAAANAAALEKQSRAGTAHNSRTSSPSPQTDEDMKPLASTSSSVDDVLAPPKKRQCNEVSREASTEPSSSRGSGRTSASAVPATRPWKSVYCERLAIERNWRRGRYTVRTLKGHTDGIMCLQFNESLVHPSFPIVITGSYDRTARIWNMDTGEELRVLRGHTRGVRCLQFDEAKLITGSMDRTLKIWNWRTGALVRTLEGHTEGIVCLNFNDHLLASGSADSNIKIWNFKTGQCHTLRGHTDWVNAVTLWSGSKKKSADSDGAEDTFLFSASDDGTIRLWDLGHNECLMVFTGHVGQCQGLSLVHMPEEVVEALAKGGNVGPNGANIDAASEDRGRPSGPGATDESTYFMTPDDSHQHAGSAGINGGVGGGSRIAPGGQSCGYNPSAVPGGRAANTGTAPAIPDHFYHPAASGQHRTQLRQLQGQGQGPAMYASPRRRKIEPQLAKLQERLESAGLVDALPIDAEMGDLEWGAAKRAVQRSHVPSSSSAPGTTPSQSTSNTGGLSASAGGSTVTSSSASASAAGAGAGAAGHQNLRPMLFSCSLDNTIKIWDVRTGVCIRTLFGHMAGLWALSTDRLRLATASHDATLKIWELATGKHLFSICEHRGPVTCVQIGDDKVISGSDDSQVNIYSFATTGSAAGGT